MPSVYHLHLTDTAWFLISGHLPFWADWYVHPLTGSGVHDHDFIEIGLVVRGTATHRWAGGEERVSPGSLVIVQPGIWHEYGPCSTPMIMFNCCMAEHLLHGEMAWLLNDPVLKYLLQEGAMANGRGGILATTIGNKGRRLCDPLLIQLNKTLRLRDESTWLDKTLAIGTALSALARAVRAADPHAASLAAAPDRHEAIRKVMTILEEDLRHEWTMPQLAEQVYLDRSYLTRLFCAQVGMAPLAYQTRLRAERAAELLLKSNDSIQRIGVMVGWDEPSYFALRFREFFGVSPREYRTALKRNATLAAD